MASALGGLTEKHAITMLSGSVRPSMSTDLQVMIAHLGQTLFHQPQLEPCAAITRNDGGGSVGDHQQPPSAAWNAISPISRHPVNQELACSRDKSSFASFIFPSMYSLGKVLRAHSVPNSKCDRNGLCICKRSSGVLPHSAASPNITC